MDISLGIPGYEEEAIGRAAEIELTPGDRVRVCSAEDLIIHKAVASRAQDNRDIEGVVLRQGKRLDVAYVRRWLAAFSEILESPEAQARFEIPWGRLAGIKT
jgi:predicted nucleotidyltransferase